MKAWLPVLFGLGCLAGGASAVLLAASRGAGRLMIGGALAFLAFFLALFCAGLLLQRVAELPSVEKEFLDRLIERETR